MDDFPVDFRCPISMELMEDPVTISTGVTYERRSIEKWFSKYDKATCPATMQRVSTSDLTPNHTLKRLIASWVDERSKASHPGKAAAAGKTKHGEIIVHLLKAMEATPFKVSSLRKLKDVIGPANEMVEAKMEFVRSGGVEAVVRIIRQILAADGCGDFAAFRACEEGLGLLNLIPIGPDETGDDQGFKLISELETVRAMAIMLQRGSQESRYHTIALLRKISKAEVYDWTPIVQDQGIDFFKSLLDLVSDDMWSKSSTHALDVLVEVLKSSKRTRVKAVEAGAVITLIELLPESTRSKCERMLYIIKLLCECADGRAALAEHGMGVAAVVKKMMNVSDTGTKLCVKILWLVSGVGATERVVEEMVVYGAVKKLLVVLHFGGGGSTREKALNMFKMHGSAWKRFECFPSDLKAYLGLGGSD
uniref:U-box domain-containing protein n=1 Tax=Kalanchoe fedtschenkoi TaxID=63787 RepID=A0A7N0V6A8_KALFE